MKEKLKMWWGKLQVRAAPYLRRFYKWKEEHPDTHFVLMVCATIFVVALLVFGLAVAFSNVSCIDCSRAPIGNGNDVNNGNGNDVVPPTNGNDNGNDVAPPDEPDEPDEPPNDVANNVTITIPIHADWGSPYVYANQDGD